VNIDDSKEFSRSLPGVHVVRLFLRFFKQDLFCVHSDGIDSSLISWVFFTVFLTVTLYTPSCVDHFSKRYMMFDCLL
jgi:hypothetical protein